MPLYLAAKLQIKIERTKKKGEKLASGMGWGISAMSSKKKSGIEKGLEDIRNGNVYHAKNSQDLISQILE